MNERVRLRPTHSRWPRPSDSAQNAESVAPAGVSNLQTLRALGIRAKLTVSQPSDPGEVEADAAADAFADGKPTPAGLSAAGDRIRRQCTHYDETARRKPMGTDSGAPIQPMIGNGAGSPLPRPTRARFERFFGTDLGGVRIHNDAAAHSSAASLRARAFAHGSNIHFARDQYRPETPEGQRLLAHELAHVMQSSGSAQIRRAPESGGDASAEPAQGPAAPGPAPAAPGLRTDSKLPDPELHPYPSVGEQAKFGGLPVSEDPSQLTNLAWHLIAYGCPDLQIGPGSEAPALYRGKLYHAGESARLSAGVCGEAGTEAGNVCRQGAVIRDKIVPAFDPVVADVSEAAKGHVAEFEKQARKNALNTLAKSKDQTMAQAIKLGITWTDQSHRWLGGGFIQHKYEMKGVTPDAERLPSAAAALLKRRNALDDAESALLKSRMSPGDNPATADQDYEREQALEDSVKVRKQEFEQSLSMLKVAHPILAAYAEDKAGLERLANSKPGKAMADEVGRKITDTLEKIERVTAGLQEDAKGDTKLNVWRIEPIMDVTKVQYGGNKVLAQLIAEREEIEKPSALVDIAIALLNIGALILAAETGGLSLAAAAAVNSVAAAYHVHEFLRQKDLAGTNFDRAAALSREDPSLFWLAVELVGTAFDVGSAASAVFNRLSPLARAAMKAAEGAESKRAIDALQTAASEIEATEGQNAHNLAKRLVDKVERLKAGETGAIKGFEAESKLLNEAGQVADIEKIGEIGKDAGAAAKNVRISKAGTIFSCASPCEEIGSKYAEILARNPKLESKLNSLREEAARAANLKAAGKVEEAEALAAKVRNAAAELEGEVVSVVLKGPIEGAPKLLSAARIATVRQELTASYPMLEKLSDEAIERIVRARFKNVKGFLELSDAGIQNMRGQIMEELTAIRVRELLGAPEKLGLKPGAGELIFVEGWRISHGGAKLSDGMILRRLGNEFELVAVIESKAGKFSAGKLAPETKATGAAKIRPKTFNRLEPLSTDTIIETVVDGKWADKLVKADPNLTGKLNWSHVIDLQRNSKAEALKDLKDRIVAAIDKLEIDDTTKFIRDATQHEGQIVTDVERLATEESFTATISGMPGGTVTVNTRTRPQFIASVPSDAAPILGQANETSKAASGGAKAAGKPTVSQRLGEPYPFSVLDMGETQIESKQLNDIAKKIEENLAGEYQAAHNAVKDGGAAAPKP